MIAVNPPERDAYYFRLCAYVCIKQFALNVDFCKIIRKKN